MGHLRRAMAGPGDDMPLRISVGDRRVFDGGAQAVITRATASHWWAEQGRGRPRHGVTRRSMNGLLSGRLEASRPALEQTRRVHRTAPDRWKGIG
ncbi:hypothetical protein [Streptomyces olivochromogenes]|uniref:hypothetical protein n=1 Tax=Streptomyces olivochromogenes TaxID=1963 RepID=UPI00350E5BF3